MKSLLLNKQFSKILALVQSASSQDVMLINETSPAMVRFLSKDNSFRTFQLSIYEEDSSRTELKLTKSNDPESALKGFKDFLEERAKEELEKDVLVEKEEVQSDLNKITAEMAHKVAVENKKLGIDPDEEVVGTKAVTKVVKKSTKKVTKKSTKRKSNKKSTKKK